MSWAPLCDAKNIEPIWGVPMKKECFSELRSANIAIPLDLEIGHYVVSATFVTEDPNDANQRKPFFPCTSEHNPDTHAITVVATRRREDANPSRYVCEYIVMATKKI